MNKILEKIESDKEILSTMPRNNKKNIMKYAQNVENMQEEYEKIQQEIFNEMNNRYNEIISVKENKEIAIEKNEIDELEKLLDIINTVKTSYEKMGIDRKIYKLGKFYKENLEIINKEILSCINKFSEVGLALSASDFDYSIYVNEYMQEFFKEIEKGNINSDSIKSKFEEIYWKCPDLIIHIELNLRYIYIKNQKVIDKYYETRKAELLKNINTNVEEIEKRYKKAKEKLEKDINVDKYLLTHAFLDGKLNAKDYSNDQMKLEYLKVIKAEDINNASEKQQEEINKNCIKFLNSLYEYKQYLKFKYIFEDIQKKYQEIEQHKNEYNTIRKEIEAKEKKLKSLNSKINGKGLFGIKSKPDRKEKQTTEYNSIVLEIKELYKKMDNAKIYAKISEHLTAESTIYDALKLASQFNNYLVDCIIENNKTITDEEIEKSILELKEFLSNPHNVIIKNITILENKNIPIIISDRYKLLNFTINKEDINEGNLDNIIMILEKIQNNYNIQKSKINLDEMEFICEFKKILDKK